MVVAADQVGVVRHSMLLQVVVDVPHMPLKAELLVLQRILLQEVVVDHLVLLRVAQVVVRSYRILLPEVVQEADCRNLLLQVVVQVEVCRLELLVTLSCWMLHQAVVDDLVRSIHPMMHWQTLQVVCCLRLNQRQIQQDGVLEKKPVSQSQCAPIRQVSAHLAVFCSPCYHRVGPLYQPHNSVL